MKKTLLAGALAALLSTSALAHTNSIGYVGDGSGGLNFWYGSWHDNTQFNEAQIKIIRPDGTSSIDTFNLLSQDSPAGLISGVNFFSSNGTALIPYDPNAVHPMGMPMESYTWQGINYTGLVTGTYTFVYIPLGDPESTLPGSPTAEWMPMDEVIRSLTINLTTGDLNGDANNNGILDVLEVSAGSASGGPSAPTVVSQGSSRVVGYIAVSGGVVQVVQRTQTDTTWDNMSDGTTANVNTSSTALPDWVGRTDQIATAQRQLGLALRDLDWNGVRFVGMSNTNSSGMNGGVSGVTVGGSKDLDNGWSIGAGVGALNTSTRDVGTADASTTLVNLHAGRDLEQGRVQLNLTHAMSDYTTTRTIGDFQNSGATQATDTWADLRFTGNGERVRPVLGLTRGVRSTDGYLEAGDVQTARTVRDQSEWYTFATIGAQATLAQGVNLEALHHTDGVNSLGVKVNREIAKDTVFTAGVSRSVSDHGSGNALSLKLVKKF